MKLLSKPALDKAPEEIFEICVKSFQDEARRKNLLECKNIVKIDSNEYESLVPSQIDRFHISELPSEVTKDALIAVYNQKFAAKGSPGRKYYDQIKALAEDCCCPICGVLPVTTLDHYLPKSKAPTLVVTYNNLVPCCISCNTEKRADIGSRPDEMPIHIYFDSKQLMTDVWLYARVGSKFEISYYTCCPDSWEPGLKGRVNNHLDIYKLHHLYSRLATTEIGNMKYLWKNMVSMPEGLTQLQLHFLIMRESAEQNDLNSWKAALYRCLGKDFAQVVKLLLSENDKESNRV